MAKFVFRNRASGTLATAITPTTTNIQLNNGQGALFPSLAADEVFHAAIVDVNGSSEIVRCTARTGDTLTVVRGVEGTTALSFAAGSRVELRLTAEIMSSFIQGNVLPPLGANLNFNGFSPINVNWSTVTIDAAQLRVSNVPVVLTTRQINVGPGLSGGGTLDNDISINVQFATATEAQNPNITDRVLAPSHLNMFTSPAFVWVTPLLETTSVYTYTHNLNRVPLVDLGLRCRVANNGYQVDDIISVHSVRRGENNSIPVVVVSTTQVALIMPSNPKFLSYSNPGTLVDLVANNWEIYARGWRL